MFSKRNFLLAHPLSQKSDNMVADMNHVWDGLVWNAVTAISAMLRLTVPDMEVSFGFRFRIYLIWSLALSTTRRAR